MKASGTLELRLGALLRCNQVELWPSRIKHSGWQTKVQGYSLPLAFIYLFVLSSFAMASKFIYLGTKVVLTLAAGSVGIMALGESMGFNGLMLEPIRISDHNGVDKWAAGAALLGMDLKLFFFALGLCKFSAAVAFWTNSLFGLETLATVLLAALYACVAFGHYQVDGVAVPPAFLCALCLIKLVTAPANRAVSKKSS
jgi:hypothetical protein